MISARFRSLSLRASMSMLGCVASFRPFVSGGLRSDVGSCSRFRRVVTEDTVVTFVADALLVKSAEAIMMVLALVASVTLPF